MDSHVDVKALEELLDRHEQLTDGCSGDGSGANDQSWRLLEEMNSILGGERSSCEQPDENGGEISAPIAEHTPQDEPMDLSLKNDNAEEVFEEECPLDLTVGSAGGRSDVVSESPEAGFDQTNDDEDEPTLLIDESEDEPTEDDCFSSDGEVTVIAVDTAVNEASIMLENMPLMEKQPFRDIVAGNSSSTEAIRGSDAEMDSDSQEGGDTLIRTCEGNRTPCRKRRRRDAEGYSYPKLTPRRRRLSTEVLRSRPLSGNPQAFEGRGARSQAQDPIEDECVEELRHPVYARVSLFLPMDFNELPISAIVVNERTIIYADFNKKRVKCIEMNMIGSYELKKGEEDFNNPSALVLSTCNNRLAVRDDDGIHIFGVPSLKYICSTVTMANPERTYGVAALPGDRFVTVDDVFKRLLYFDATTGAFLYDKDLPMLDMMPASDAPASRFRFIHADVRGRGRSVRITLSDYGLSKIFVVDENAEFLFSFGSYGHAEGRLSGPHAVTVDYAGQFIVADSFNDRYQVFDMNGKFKHNLPLVGAYRVGRLVGLHAWVPKPENSAVPLPYEGLNYLGTSFKTPGIFLFQITRNPSKEPRAEPLPGPSISTGPF